MSQNVPSCGYYNPMMINAGMQQMPMQMPMGMNTGMINPMGQLPMNNYANDMFAPDFIRNPYAYMNTQVQSTAQNQQGQNNSIFDNAQAQVPQTQVQPQTQSFTANPQIQQVPSAQETPQSQEQQLISETPKTNIGKKIGVAAGVSIPLFSSLSKVLNGAKFSDVLKFKDLGIKGIAFAVAGWCAGALLDGFLNSNNTKTTQV